jgi:hypothetical protein
MRLEHLTAGTMSVVPEEPEPNPRKPSPNSRSRITRSATPAVYDAFCARNGDASIRTSAASGLGSHQL